MSVVFISSGRVLDVQLKTVIGAILSDQNIVNVGSVSDIHDPGIVRKDVHVQPHRETYRTTESPVGSHIDVLSA